MSKHPTFNLECCNIFLHSLKKFLSNKNTITILGVLVGVVVLYLGYNWRVTKSIQPILVPYSTSTLLAGTRITEEYINYASIPKDTVSGMGNLVTNVSEISGKLVSYDSKIPQNGFFFKENLISEEEMPDSVFSNIPDGHTIFGMQVTNTKLLGNSIFPGDLIDIYMYTTEDGKVVYGRFIKQIEVLAVKDSNGNNVFTDKDDLGEASMLLFAVPEDLFLLLKKAEKVGIEFDLVPRNDSYSTGVSIAELKSDELKDMIINKTYILQNECQDLTVCG